MPPSSASATRKNKPNSLTSLLSPPPPISASSLQKNGRRHPNPDQKSRFSQRQSIPVFLNLFYPNTVSWSIQYWVLLSHMGRVVQDLWRLIIIICAVFLQSTVLHSQDLSCDSNDSRALRDFFNELESAIDGWPSNASANCCHWPGVTCNSSNGTADSGRVVGLSLGSKRLVGKISISLGQLDQLRVLNLSRNRLGDELPSPIFHLRNLEVLDLSFNDLSGAIPETADLDSIQFLDISQNSFNGSLPVGICANSFKLQVLNLSANYFNGLIPFGFNNCGILEELNIGTNELSGRISSSDIFQLQRLVRLDLSVNGFSGEIPNAFQNLTSLQFFIAHSNQFIGSIPSSLSNLGSLVFLNLRNNSLGGKIDLNCSAMTELESLDLATNNFVGPLPENLPKCGNLININLAKNKFIGEQIPDSFSNFQSLAYLSLSNSSLRNVSSAFSILQHCRNLTYLVLTLNFYDEELPSDPTLNFPKLQVLIMAAGRLTGSVPHWITKSTNLQLLDLSWNKLSGSIPPWIGDFQSLFYLDISNNSISGEIPREITGLQSLFNRTGPLQDPSPDFPLFMKRDVSLMGYHYKQVSSLPPTMDLGYNSLNGSIWPEFGNLKTLHILDLRNNFLSGSIPGEFSGMTSLETMDLSYNNLSGTLPSSLASLNFLSKFSVAHNDLIHGQIPTGTQFATFPNSSFEGTQLCGGDHAPLCQSSDRPGTSSVSDNNRSRRNREVIYAVVVGIVIGSGFLLAITLLIVRRTHSRGESDPEMEGRRGDTDKFENSALKLLVMFQHDKEDGNKEKLGYDDIISATNNFDQSNIIGCGGFGMVYKAILSDGRKLAIKKLSGDCGEMEREFRAEVETLSRAQHPNLVHLEGYCMDKDVRLLIYSYMQNSSLDYWLHEKPDSPSALDWKTRLRIAQGAARGLVYLHQSCEPHILHRDIKSSNILLDENFEAHLADFGLARLICAYDTHVSTDLVGTLGYIPPEYGQASIATYKGDVYSFGVVLLELLTGKRPMDICKPRGARDLISWVIQMKKEKKEAEVFDRSIYGKQPHHDKEMMQVFEISCHCLNDSPKVRPSTQLLVSYLDKVGAD